MSDKTSPAAQIPQPKQNRPKRRWLIVLALVVVIAGSLWRTLFFELWDSDEFKPPPIWDGTPAFRETAVAKNDPPPNAGILDRLRFVLQDFWLKCSGISSRATYTFQPRTNALHGISSLLTPCMEITGKKYLIAREVIYVEFGHTNALNGTQWVAAVEALLQSAQVQCYRPGSNDWRERLLLIREEGVVKVVPPSRLADYQNARLVSASYKPQAITNSTSTP